MAEESHDQERVLEGSDGDENGSDGSSNGFVHVESSAESSHLPVVAEIAAQGSREGEVLVTSEPVDVDDMLGSVNQEPSSLQVEHVDEDIGLLVNRANPIQDDQNDVKTEDGGREDMFVDCPDELVVYDGKTSDNREVMAIPEIEENAEHNDDEHETVSPQVSDGRQVHVLMDELEHLRAVLEKTIGEKESFARENEELQATVVMKDQEIEDLHAKLEKDGHIEAIANRVLASLATTVNQEVLDDSVFGKFSYIENNTSFLIEKYNQFLSEIYQLRQCLTEGRSELSVEDNFQTIFVTAREELLELKTKEVDFAQKISHLEAENAKLAEQLDIDREKVEMAKSEIGKLKVELEQEKTKSANTKEKLSLAVTKGKALVQQRDSLKQSIAEKTSELEKYLIELQEKSIALQAAEQTKEELTESENLAAQLQEKLTQRDAILEKCEEILSESGIPEELQSANITEKMLWLVDERNALKGVSIEFHKITDALSLINSSENVSYSDLESQIRWLVESSSLNQLAADTLQSEVARIKEAAHNDIDRLTTSLLTEIQEKSYLQEELEDLTQKYQEAVEKEHQVSLEKDRMIGMLHEASGITLDNQEEGCEQDSDMATVIDRCIGKVKEQNNASFGLSHVEEEMFEHIQTLLYTRDLELLLHKEVIEEEMVDRSELTNLSNELKVVYVELQRLKDEREFLQKDFERADEKSALVREKLSMAVKKGKGLVQERENLKRLLDEKNANIEKLTLEIKQQESTLRDCSDQLNKLSTDVERIPNLVADLAAMEDQRNQLEQFLVDSNNMLQRLIESIDGIVLPVDLTFEEPVEKVEWLGGYINESQVAKTLAEEELGKVEAEANTLASKLGEAYTTMKSLEDALSVAEKNISQLTKEKRELEVAKTNVEQELQKAMEEASSQAGKFAEVCVTRKSLEDALSMAENNISVLINEKEDAQIGKGAAEKELEKVTAEFSVQTSKLGEACRAIKSLEDALSEVERNVSFLSEENSRAQVGRTSLENEIKRLKEEAETRASELAEAQNNISELVGEKRSAEEEISTLNSKLNACMEELAGTHGSIESRSLELSGHLNSLQMFLKDETLLSLLRQSFERNFESLRNIDLLLKDIKDHFVQEGSEILQNNPVFEEDSHALKLVSAALDDIANVPLDMGDVNAADGDDMSSPITETVKAFHVRNKILADRVEGCSTSFDEYVAVLSTKLHATRDYAIVMLEHTKSLKQKVNNMEIDREAQDNTIAMLGDNISILKSACIDATQHLDVEVENNPLGVSTASELEKWDFSLLPEEREVSGGAINEAAEKLLFAATSVRALSKRLENERNQLTSAIEDLHTELKETRTTLENAIEERDLNQNRVPELENDVEELQNLCNEMRSKLDDHQAKEDELNEREAEISSLMKDKEVEDAPLSSSQLKSVFDKINESELPFPDSEVDEVGPRSLTNVKKLFYIIDTAIAVQHQVKLLSLDKEELQSTLEKQFLEYEHLKEEIQEHIRNKKNDEETRSELFDLKLGLENTIKKLGGNDFVGDHKFANVRGLVPVLEKLVMATILESENTKSKAQELGAKLLGSQRVVDELSTKVKFLEDSTQTRAASSDTVQERSIFEPPSLPTRSEISEVEDLGPSGTTAISPAPSAPHVRTLRKGSTDHLAINIDSELDRLISDEETDEDKGHIFKSLNTTGLVPIQGKMVADRIDGIWVSGGRALMSRPRARLGLIAYWLVLHLWLLGTIL